MANTRIHRFPPCPAYDIEGTESWLQDMAARGWMLYQWHPNLGFAAFEKEAPRTIRFRLEPVQGDARLQQPDAETATMFWEYGWKFLCRWDLFFLFYSEADEPRELHTDPEVQAMALDVTYKRQKRNCVLFLLWTIVTWLNIGSPLLLYFLAGPVGFCIVAAGTLLVLPPQVLRLGYLRKVRKQLAAGTSLSHSGRRMSLYLHSGVHTLLSWVIILAMLCVPVAIFRSTDDNRSPISQAEIQSLPFATLQDLASNEGSACITKEATLQQKSDWLGTYLFFQQEGAIQNDGEPLLQIGLDVQYFQTPTPWLARQLARELHFGDFWDSLWKHEELETQELEADYAAMYISNYYVHLVIAEGNEVLRIRFLPYGSIPEKWPEIFAGSLSKDK